GMRFRAAPKMTVDEAGGIDSREISLARKNFRLLLDIEPADGLITLPLARVRRDGSGHFVYDPTFVPPALQIGASPSLMALLDRLLEMISARSEALANEGDGDERTAV